MTAPFELQFPASEITCWSRRYKIDKREVDALEAGNRIRDGEHTPDNLLPIVKWKAERAKTRVQSNYPAEIADALNLACSAKTERSAVAVLRGLFGVQIPMASAILTAVFPDRFTIIDFRALEALGGVPDLKTISFYLCYLAECRRLAAQHKCDLRTLDRAMWQWSKERRPDRSGNPT